MLSVAVNLVDSIIKICLDMPMYVMNSQPKLKSSVKLQFQAYYSADFFPSKPKKIV